MSEATGDVLRLDPLRAWRFVAGKVSALGAVTSPPYDVLEPALVRRLTDSDLHNMVRLILPRDPDLGRGRYDEPARRLVGWQRDGIVIQDRRPALYVYEQQFGGADPVGLVGALGLDPDRHVVLPHENVMQHWVDDRFELMEATDADLEPILLAYAGGGTASDAVDEARAGVPWLVADTEDGAAPPDLADRRPGHPGRDRRRDRQARGPDRRRPPPLRRVPGTLPPRTATHRNRVGLAMLVDNERHPLTLDPIHRVVPGLTLDLVKPVRRTAGTCCQAGSRTSRTGSRSSTAPPGSQCARPRAR